MTEKDLPKWYKSIKAKHEKYINSLDELGKVIKQEGPLDRKDSTSHSACSSGGDTI